MKKRITCILLFLALFVLIGCGGGGGDDGGGGDIDPTQDPKPEGDSDGPYLGYSVNSTVYAVDKDDHSVIQIADNLGDFSSINHVNDHTFMVYRMSADSSLNVTIGEPELLVYVGTDKFWKVDMARDSNLVPQELLSQAYDDLCNVEFDSDSFSLERNVLFYELPGADSDCKQKNDNTRWMMRVAKLQNYNPVEITSATDNLESIQVVRNFLADNAAAGFIAISGNNINHYDANFANPSLITTSADAKDTAATRLSIGDINSTGGFIQVDRVVYWYDFQAKTLTPRHTMATDTYSSGMTCDDAECYFKNGAQFGSSDISIYKVPADGSNDASLVATVAGGTGSSSSEVLAPDFLFIANGNTHNLISVSRANGTVSTIDTEVYGIFGSASHLYYNRGQSAVVRTNDGSAVGEIEFVNSAWLGFSYGGINVLESQVFFDSFILVQRAVGANDLSNATVRSFDPDTNQIGFDLGILPERTFSIFGAGFGSGGMLSRLAVATDSGPVMDILWLNPSVGGGFERLTDNPDDETVVDFSG